MMGKINVNSTLAQKLITSSSGEAAVLRLMAARAEQWQYSRKAEEAEFVKLENSNDIKRPPPARVRLAGQLRQFPGGD